MKAIRIFLWITTIVITIGSIDMFATYDFDVYALWQLVSYWSAIYYIENSKNV